MKRADYLRDLSSEHHLALRLVRTIRRCPAEGSGRASLIAEIRALFVKELEPHFIAEEQLLLPELSRLGEAALADRTLEEHRELRQWVAGLEAKDALGQFADALEAHVRFEERTLFPACQEVFDEAAVASVEEGMASRHGRD